MLFTFVRLKIVNHALDVENTLENAHNIIFAMYKPFQLNKIQHAKERYNFGPKYDAY